MIKGIFFDYDGVITPNGAANQPIQRLAEAADVTLEQAKDVFWPLWPDYLRGNIDEANMWHRLETGLNTSIPEANRHIWSTWKQLQPQPEMLAFISKLGAKGITSAVLSNVTPTTKDDLLAHGAYEPFAFRVLSSEVHEAKPDKAIFEIALQRMTQALGDQSLRPEQTIFVDDQERNLVAARHLGIQVVLAHDATQTIRDVDRVITSN